MRRVGAHMSISGGLHLALERALALGCESVQLFLKNARSWAPRTPKEGEVEAFKRLSQGLWPLVAHSTYLINLASPDDYLYEKSLKAFLEEMKLAELLGVTYYVLHPGSHMGIGEREGFYRVARALNLALYEVPRVEILLETASGGKHTLGSKFEHLAAILEMIEEEDRVGVCLDTCHLWASGYDIHTPRGYERTFEELEALIGFEKVKLIHANDSKTPLGKGADRHEHIGLGHIGLDGFRLLLGDERLKGLPLIIETPKGRTPEGEDWDMVNISTLRRLEMEDEGQGHLWRLDPLRGFL